MATDEDVIKGLILHSRVAGGKIEQFARLIIQQQKMISVLVEAQSHTGQFINSLLDHRLAKKAIRNSGALRDDYQKIADYAEDIAKKARLIDPEIDFFAKSYERWKDSEKIQEATLSSHGYKYKDDT